MDLEKPGTPLRHAVLCASRISPARCCWRRGACSGRAGLCAVRAAQQKRVLCGADDRGAQGVRRAVLINRTARTSTSVARAARSPVGGARAMSRLTMAMYHTSMLDHTAPGLLRGRQRESHFSVCWPRYEQHAGRSRTATSAPTRKVKRFDELVKLVEKQQTQCAHLKKIYEVGRPSGTDGWSREREQAMRCCSSGARARVTKSEPDDPFVPDEVGIEEASAHGQRNAQGRDHRGAEPHGAQGPQLVQKNVGLQSPSRPDVSGKYLPSSVPDRRDRLGGERMRHQRTVDQVHHRQCEHRARGRANTIAGHPGNIKNLIDGLGEMEMKRRASPRRVRQPRVS